MTLRKLSALAAGAAIAFAACTTPSGGGGGASPGGGGSGAPAPSGDTSKGTVKIAIGLPYEGSEKAASDPIINGVKLAVKDAGGAAGGYALSVPDVFDDAVNGKHDEQQGATNMQTIVQDPEIVAMIGPLNSSVAAAQIPISNAAGLFQCSPANTNPGLTKPDFGAGDLRTKENNYVRVVTTDDIQGPAAATYTFNTLGAESVYIIDDTETFGKGVADAFEAQFEEEGGTVVKHDAAPPTTTDYTSILTAAAALNPDAVYFGGVTASGADKILKAAVQVGLGEIPFVGPDGINDGSGDTPDSFLNLVGADAANAYSTLAGIGDFPQKATFDEQYKAEYGIDATGYAGTGYACAQIVIDALNRAGASAPAGDIAALREAVRVAGVDSSVTYSTILGDIQFDENGDTNQLIISIYSYDSDAKDWVFEEQVDFAEAGG
jgi:branched-chain amino acid transport system substrate-binding protein